MSMGPYLYFIGIGNTAEMLSIGIFEKDQVLIE